MEALKKIKSQIIPIPRKDIDTDIIIPAEYMTSVSKEGYAEGLFARFKDDEDFRFVKKFPDAKILVARDNFGCGSSREHAVWALMSWGFRVIIAPSFANIHQNNALKNGLLEITLKNDVIEKILFEALNAPQYEMTVDLENQKIILPNKEEYSFDIDPFRKTCILKGMDDFDYLLSKKDKIDKFNAERKKRLYFDLKKLR